MECVNILLYSAWQLKSKRRCRLAIRFCSAHACPNKIQTLNKLLHIHSQTRKKLHIWLLWFITITFRYHAKVICRGYKVHISIGWLMTIALIFIPVQVSTRKHSWVFWAMWVLWPSVKIIWYCYLYGELPSRVSPVLSLLVWRCKSTGLGGYAHYIRWGSCPSLFFLRSLDGFF